LPNYVQSKKEKTTKPNVGFVVFLL